MEILIVFSIVAAIIAIGVYFERKREKALKEFALKSGFTILQGVNAPAPLQFEGFSLFSQGRNRTIKTALRRDNGAKEITIFDYSYTVGSGKNKSTYTQTVFVINCKELALPAFAIRPESVFNKIGQLFGYQDIDFAENPEFSRKYLVRSEEELALRKMFIPRVLSFFTMQKNMCAEGRGNTLITYTFRGRAKPQAFHNEIRRASELADLFIRAR